MGLLINRSFSSDEDSFANYFENDSKVNDLPFSVINNWTYIVYNQIFVYSHFLSIIPMEKSARCLLLVKQLFTLRKRCRFFRMLVRKVDFFEIPRLKIVCPYRDLRKKNVYKHHKYEEIALKHDISHISAQFLSFLNHKIAFSNIGRISSIRTLKEF